MDSHTEPGESHRGRQRAFGGSSRSPCAGGCGNAGRSAARRSSTGLIPRQSRSVENRKKTADPVASIAAAETLPDIMSSRVSDGPLLLSDAIRGITERGDRRDRSQWPFIIRRANVSDRSALEHLEKTHFPVVEGSHHAGFLFEDTDLAVRMLSLPANAPVGVPVAEVNGDVVGFAAFNPFSFPGGAGLDKKNTLLQHVAVDTDHRGKGIGKALVNAVVARLRNQDVIVAHVPTAQTAFYESIGWTVVTRNRGFAWVPRGDFIRADVPDTAIGYPHMAYKILRPNSIIASFDFPKLSGRPVLDASARLKDMIAAGEIRAHQLDSTTLESVALVTAMGPPPSRGAFGQRA